MRTKQEVLREHLRGWLLCKGNRKKRGEMTKSMSSLLRIHPKSVGRAFTALQLKSHRHEELRGRSIYYGNDVSAALYDVWNTMDRICAENLHSHIGVCIGNLQKHGHWSHGDIATGKLCAMSLGTLKNRVGRLMDKYEPLHGRSATRPSHLKNIIPIFKSPWSGFPPGYGQLAP